jgi:hypothetical protein
MTATDPGISTPERPFTHVAELLRTYKPGYSVRQIEREAGLKEGALKNYFKPSTAPSRMPASDVIKRFAHAIGARVEDTARAFASDVDIPLDIPELTSCEHEHLAAFRALPPDMQRVATTLVTALVTHTGAANAQVIASVRT